MPAALAWADGRASGKALALDGKESHVELPAGLFKDLSDFTVSMWTYLNSNHWDSCLLVVGQDNTAYMRLVPKAGTFRFSICACTYQDERTVQTAQALPTGRWVHVAATLKGTTASLYVDGKLAALDASIVLSPHQLGDQVRRLGGDAVHPSINGRIADFRVYSGALTADEILALAR